MTKFEFNNVRTSIMFCRFEIQQMSFNTFLINANSWETCFCYRKATDFICKSVM